MLAASRGRDLRFLILILSASLCAFLISDRWFSPLDDEITDILYSRTSPLAMLRPFWSGQGLYIDHTPLAEILFHYWIPVAGRPFWLLRLPAVLFYLTGLTALAFSARRMAGTTSFRATLWLGALWPFAFHFGRLAAWYSLAFMLVALATLGYLRLLDKRSYGRTLAFTAPALLLLYTNYFGVAILALLLFDLVVVRRQRVSHHVFAAVAVIVFGSLPLWFGLHRLLPSVLGDTPSMVGRPLLGAFNLYSLFVSESVAPWFWVAAVPACAAIGGAIYCTWTLLARDRRPWLIYFFVLFLTMVCLGLLTTKRALFLSDWLLLAVALALAAPRERLMRRALVFCLMVIAAIGWGGIVSRNYYSAPHFIEPWATVAATAIEAARKGTVVVTNSRILIFTMGYLDPEFDAGVAYPLPRSGVLNHASWRKTKQRNWPSVLFVRGTYGDVSGKVDSPERWLADNCKQTAQQNLAPDSGYAFKARYFPRYDQPAYRIQLSWFDCSSPTR